MAADELRTSVIGANGPPVYHVQLPAFEGPLDLLLHLIQTHQVNIMDIPMRFITERYLEYLQLMQSLAIDIASEYLVMAAVLTHIKSKMLLPHVPADQQGDDLETDEPDPREELVRRLLEYQKYKTAAAELQRLGEVGQDAFSRPAPPPEPAGKGPLAPFPVFQLFDAFNKLLTKKRIRIDHEVTFERLTITERIHQLTTLLRERRTLLFEDLFEANFTRFDLVITFLALLEMARLRMTRLFQTDPLSALHIECALSESEEGEPQAPHELTS